jgi:hypothetical protein
MSDDNVPPPDERDRLRAEVARLTEALRLAAELNEAATSFAFDGPGGWYHVSVCGGAWSITTLGNRFVSSGLGKYATVAEARRLAAEEKR